MRRILLLPVLFVFLVHAAGCASLRGDVVETSGFMSDYSQLKPGRDEES